MNTGGYWLASYIKYTRNQLEIDTIFPRFIDNNNFCLANRYNNVLWPYNLHEKVVPVGFFLSLLLFICSVSTERCFKRASPNHDCIILSLVQSASVHFCCKGRNVKVPYTPLKLGYIQIWTSYQGYVCYLRFQHPPPTPTLTMAFGDQR